MSPLDHMTDGAKHLMDAASIGAALMAVIGIIPIATTILGFVWFLMRIYQTWLEIRVQHKKLREDD